MYLYTNEQVNNNHHHQYHCFCDNEQHQHWQYDIICKNKIDDNSIDCINDNSNIDQADNDENASVQLWEKFWKNSVEGALVAI